MIEGAEFRNFLRDKLIRTFVKKGVRIECRPCEFSNCRIMLIIISKHAESLFTVVGCQLATKVPWTLYSL